MTSIKDKLASSVRQAKSAKNSKVSKTPAAKPITARGAKGAKQGGGAPDSKREVAIAQRPQEKKASQEPVSSTQALFPDRVWPD